MRKCGWVKLYPLLGYIAYGDCKDILNSEAWSWPVSVDSERLRDQPFVCPSPFIREWR